MGGLLSLGAMGGREGRGRDDGDERGGGVTGDGSGKGGGDREVRRVWIRRSYIESHLSVHHQQLRTI